MKIVGLGRAQVGLPAHEAVDPTLAPAPDNSTIIEVPVDIDVTRDELFTFDIGGIRENQGFQLSGPGASAGQDQGQDQRNRHNPPHEEAQAESNEESPPTNSLRRIFQGLLNRVSRSS